jgi:hypothetical protein
MPTELIFGSIWVLPAQILECLDCLGLCHLSFSPAPAARGEEAAANAAATAGKRGPRNGPRKYRGCSPPTEQRRLVYRRAAPAFAPFMAGFRRQSGAIRQPIETVGSAVDRCGQRAQTPSAGSRCCA